MSLAYLVYSIIPFFTILFVKIGNLYSINNQANRRTWFFWLIAIFFYVLILGFRDGVGIDYESYKHHFNQVLYNYGGQKDIIYYIFLPIVQTFHYNFFIAFLAFLTIFFLLKYFGSSTDFSVWFLVMFFGLGIFFLSLNIMRQTAASFVMMYAISNYFERKKIVSLFFILVAFILHKSILIIVPIFFVLKFLPLVSTKIQQIVYVIFFSASQFLFERVNNFIFVFVYGILTNFNLGHYNYYLENNDDVVAKSMEAISEANGTGLFTLFLFLMDFLVISHNRLLIKAYNRGEFRTFYYLFFIGTIFSTVFSGHEILARVISLFTFYRLIVYAVFFHQVFSDTGKKTNNVNRYIGILSIVIMILFYYRNILFRRMEIAPYDFINIF